MTLDLYLDLGDLLTKALAEQGGKSKQLRFPSVVAHRLLSAEAGHTELLLDDRQRVARMSDFDPGKYPRTRSYPMAAEVLAEAAPVAGARFAGWLAVKLGADRRLLGSDPSEELVDALVRKALMQLDRAGFDCRTVRVVMIVDLGAKTDVLMAYAASRRTLTMMVHGIRRGAPRRLEIELSFEIADGADCAALALADACADERARRWLLCDLGYLRSKLAILTPTGCALQQQVDGLGVADCVRRLLRDEQEHGLIEDELAVVAALERSHSVIEVAGRRFDIEGTLTRAKRALVEEIGAAARRVITAHYATQGEACTALAVIGGGAAVFGAELAAHLCASDLGLQTRWVSPDPSFLLTTGAKRKTSARGARE